MDVVPQVFLRVQTFCVRWGENIRQELLDYSIRRNIKSYEQAVVTSSTLPVLSKQARGAKHLLPEEINEKAVAIIKNMLSAGTVVNYDITISIAKGIVCANDRTLIKEIGGYIYLTTSPMGKSWSNDVEITLTQRI